LVFSKGCKRIYKGKNTKRRGIILYYQQQMNQPDFLHPYLIEVSGTAGISISPDLGTINLGVMTEDKELLKAQQQNSFAINNVIRSLLDNGIPKQQIQTFDYRIDSEYDFVEGKQLFRGFKVTHLLQVKIEELSLIGKIIDAATEQGANYAANVQFSVKNQESHYQKALSIALNDALNKANEIAKKLKVRLDATPVLIIEESGGERPFLPQGATYVKGLSTTTVEPGQLQVKAKIIAHFRYTH
jgi:uncharacterized protein YggE